MYGSVYRKRKHHRVSALLKFQKLLWANPARVPARRNKKHNRTNDQRMEYFHRCLFIFDIKPAGFCMIGCRENRFFGRVNACSGEPHFTNFFCQYPSPLPTSSADLPCGFIPSFLIIPGEYPTRQGLTEVFSRCKIVSGLHHMSPCVL